MGSVRSPMSSTIFDPVALRADFSFTERDVRGRRWIYLDSAATTQKPRAVLNAERDFSENFTSAVHRGAHAVAGEATELFEESRVRLAAFVGVSPNEIVWTSGATAGINLLAYAISNASLGHSGADAAQFRIGPGDEIVVTEAEHHANLIPWQECAKRTGATLRVIEVDDRGALRIDQIEQIIGERTRIVACAHVSNVLGTINPIVDIARRAHQYGALVVLDACQSVPHLPTNFRELDVDFAVFSGHKMLGPTGVGVLYGRAELLDALPPFLTGGSMITSVTLTDAEFLPSPQRFEAGTQPVSQAYALARACDYLDTVGLPQIAEYEAQLGQRLAEGLSALPGVRLLGPAPGHSRVGLASVVVDGVHAHDVGQFLDDRGIAVRVGHHCAQPLHRRYGVSASTRISTYLYTTEDEVDAAITAVGETRAFFGADTA